MADVAPPNRSLSEFRRLLPYLRRYRTSYLLGVACVLATVGLRFAVPYLLGDSIDLLRAAGDQPAPAEVEHLAGLVAVGAIGIAVAAAAGAAVRTFSRLLILGNSRKAVHDVRADVFAALLRLSPSFYVRHRTGHIMSRVVNDMQNVQGLLGPVVLYLVETALLFVVGIAFMVSASPLLAAIALVPFPLFLVLARRLARRLQEGSRAAQEKLGEVTAKVDESLSGHRVVKSLVIEHEDAAQFAAVAGEYSSTMLGVARTRAAMVALMSLLATISTVSVLAVGTPLVRGGEVSVGAMVSMVLYVAMLATPTRTLGFVLSSLQRAAAALARIGELLEMPATIRGGTSSASITEGAIEINGLTVDHAAAADLPHLSGSLPDRPGGERRRVLDDIHLSIPAGSTMAIVGPVGAGKSTLLGVLAREVELDRGMVSIDGVDITDFSLPAVRRAVGFARQDPFLFGDTLANNIAFGVPDAATARIEQAVEVAQLGADVAELPNGLATMIGERGVSLSGGQRQRTSLARVVLLRPPVLLLDDTLSAVDTDTADAILARLRPLMAGRTTVIAAHRLSTVQDADQIVVIEDGRITERGTHEELIGRGGYYASVYRRQSVRAGIAEELGLEGDV